MTGTNTKSLNLPTLNGGIEAYTIKRGHKLPNQNTGSKNWNRKVYAAAHVVCNPFSNNSPTLETSVDWDATLAFRQHLWAQGFGVAEAMDTAQRGMGLDWPTSLELIQRSASLAKSGGHLIASGAGTDHLELSSNITIDDVIAAYEMQCEAVEATGSRVILMASRALATVAKSADDYLFVYEKILSGLSQPAILHWLGDMFDPALSGYWGSQDLNEAMNTCLDIIMANEQHINGIKISLLSKQKEIDLRRRLPKTVKMYTGDDFNYPELIAGDEQGYSHALLGIFDPIAGVASRALSSLSEGKIDEYHQIIDGTVALSRHIFKAPTRFYKTGVVFMAYLNGYQNHFTMVAGQENTRSTQHLAEIIRLASDAGLFPEPELTAMRAANVFAARSVEKL